MQFAQTQRLAIVLFDLNDLTRFILRGDLIA